MTPRSPKDPREASTEARKRIRDQYAAFPEEEEDFEANVEHSTFGVHEQNEESEDEYVMSDDGDEEPIPKRLRTQIRTSSGGNEDEAKFDDLAYQKANECPPWHPSTKQPDEDDEEFKPVLDQDGEIVESIENTKDKKSARMQELDLEIVIERIRLNLKELELERVRLGNMEDDVHMD